MKDDDYPARVERAMRNADLQHEKWHRMFGDDCRRPGCPNKKEAAK